MEQKYKLTAETRDRFNTTLHKIEAIRDFGDVKAGEKGGFVESEGNLAHSGDARVSGNVRVTRTPKVLDGFPYILTITDHHVRAGCKQFPPSVWRKRGVSIILADGHSQNDSEAWAKIINAIADAHGCTDPE